MKTLSGIAIILGLLILAGCSSPSGMVYGEVVQTPIIGKQAPEIVFRDQSGEVHRLYSDDEEPTIIAFINNPCSPPDSKLVSVSNSLKGDVKVVEICRVPGSTDCSQHEQCVKNRGDAAKHIISLCDGNSLARKWFEHYSKNTVFLLDRNGVIRSEGTVADLENMKRTAVKFVKEKEYEEEMDDTFSG